MFRTVGDQVSLWESMLPDELLVLPVELARVDALLDDPAFFAPFVPFFDPRIGRPSTPMEKKPTCSSASAKFRYRLGYESLCREVSDSITLATVLPDPAGRSGVLAPDHADEAHDPVRFGGGGGVERDAAGQSDRGEGAAHDQTARGHHGGAELTWSYPTHSGLLAKAIGRMAFGDPQAHPGRRRGDPHQGARPARAAGASARTHRREAAQPQRRSGPRAGIGCGSPHDR